MNAHPHASADWLGVAVFGLALAAAGYLWATTRAGRRWSRWRTASWLGGCLLVAAGLALDRTAVAGDPRTHMAQHLVLGMLAPLGLVLAAPVRLGLAVAGRRVRRGFARVARSLRWLTHPVVAGLLSAGGLYLVMLTPLYAAAHAHPVGHQLIHLHYLLAGCLYAWVVAGPDPAPRRPGLAGRVALLVAASAAHACLAKLLYAGADRLPPGLADRDPAAWQAAAELMYYGGTGADLLLATALFAAWYRRRGPAYRRVAAVRAPGPCRSVDAGVSRVDGGQ